jgi:glycosyltransferase involved in cell wall biosynthesis
MVEPGSVDSLVRGLAALVDDPGRRAVLGAEARALAVERHTWREHTARIVRALGQVVPAVA